MAILTKRTNLADMQVGDVIPCRYTATSGTVGTFSELGTCIADEIPVVGSATPNGLFYFIKVDKGLLIADRAVQTSISWSTLNAGHCVEAMPFVNKITPIMTSQNTPSPNVVSSSVADYSTYYNYNIFDGIITSTTGWIPNVASANCWVQIDLGSLKKCNKIAILPAYGSGANPSRVKNWTLKGSIDGTTFVDIISGLHDNTQTFQTISFNAVEYRYYRIILLDSYQSYGITELELYYDEPILIRSLSGGVAFADVNGNKATTNNSLGSFPTNNEWDKYIVNSDLGGKITKGDNNVWHWSGVATWCKDTPILEINTSVYRCRRGYTLCNTALFNGGYNSASSCFRPVLEYIEPDAKATTLWY